MRKTYLVLVSAILAVSVWAQAPTASLSGRVTDQTGAVIPNASVSIVGPDGNQVHAISDQLGRFQAQSLPPGTYIVTTKADGFTPYTKSDVTLTAGHTFSVEVTLQVQAQEEKVSVQSERPTQLDLSSSSNAGSLVIKDKDLEALSDDPDELQSELQALAGPSAGPSGGQIYIDGFTGGQLPPKSAIREIRINQNPFSAQYDKLGYGRVEILTKPGSDKLHGQFFFNDSNAIFNSRNPFVEGPKPSYNTYMFDGNVGGPVNKKASFFFDASRRNIDEFAAINAIDPTTFADVNSLVPTPRRRTSLTPRLDYQLTQNNTLTARYQYTFDSHENSGLGLFSLPSQAYNEKETEHDLQLSDTQIISPQVVNETRFQWERETNRQLPLSSAPQIQVQGAFVTGGNSEGTANDIENSYELQNYTSITHGSHLIKFGARLRGITDSNFANPNFNGSFVFAPTVDNLGNPVSALQAYQNAIASPNACNSTSYDPGSCPTQYSVTTGIPRAAVSWFDAGLYAEDEWRVRPNLSLTYGLRFETQNSIHDHGDFAPRLGVAWGLGSDGKTAPKTVLRAGFGMFYDRFAPNLLLQAERLNGVNQVSTVYPDPEFFLPVPPQPSGSTVSPTIYQVSPDLRAPYTVQNAVSLERQFSKAATVSITYLNSIGNHAFFISNINAPDPSQGGLRPLAGTYGNDNVYQYDSEGVFRQNQLIANARLSLSRKVSLFGFYTLSYANSNVAGGGGGFGGGVRSSASFLTDQFDPMADYGRAAFDVRHRAFIGGSIEVPYGFRFNPFIIIQSGMPYSITTGQDNNGDSIFNDRAWLTSNAFSCTSPSSFTMTEPTTSPRLVPVNSCTGPSNTTINLRLAKTFGFGPETKGGGGGGDFGGPRGGPRGGPPGGGLGPRGLGGGGNPFGFGGSSNHRYSLTFSIMARNLLNSQNPGLPVGSLSSPFFGQTISMAGGPFSSASANRRIDLQVMFSF